MTRDEFAAWFEAQDLACSFCGVPEHLVHDLGIPTQRGHRLRYLGIDRIRSDAPYRPDNLAIACYACNRVKSDVFDDAEMRLVLGPGIGAVWGVRLGLYASSAASRSATPVPSNLARCSSHRP